VQRNGPVSLATGSAIAETTVGGKLPLDRWRKEGVKAALTQVGSDFVPGERDKQSAGNHAGSGEDAGPKPNSSSSGPAMSQ
jgi:hypothetical protein